MLPQPFDVLDQQWCGVAPDITARPRGAGAALVVLDQPVVRRIVEAARARIETGPGTAVDAEHRHAVRSTGLLVVEVVAVAEVEATAADREIFGVQVR